MSLLTVSRGNNKAMTSKLHFELGNMGGFEGFREGSLLFFTFEDGVKRKMRGFKI